MGARFLKREVKFLLFVFAFIFLFQGQIGLAFFEKEISKRNKITTAIVNVDINSSADSLVSEAVAGDINYMETVERDFIVENTGTEDVQYKISYENISGLNDPICMTLGIEAKLNGVDVYGIADGPLSPAWGFEGFSHKVDLLEAGSNDSWELDITWYETMNRDFYEGTSCEFKFTFDTWQTIYSDSTQGWSDYDELNNNEIAVLEPLEINNLEDSYLVDTKNNANNLKINITWDTNRDATTKIVYDTVAHANWQDYAFQNISDTTADNSSHFIQLSDLTDDTTYYYKVISDDRFDNQAVGSGSFKINDADVDNSIDNILMNEFLPNPEGDDDAEMPNGEWIELYNKGLVAVDVSGWYFEYNNSDQLLISATNSDNNQDTDDSGETIVPAGEYLVVYDNSGSFSLGDSSGLIELYTSRDVLVDSYNYGSEGDIPVTIEGKTYARIPDGGFWVDPDGTPGEENELGDAEIQLYRELAFQTCFDERDFDKEKQDEAICNLEFLDYLGMIKSRNDLRIPKDIYETLVQVDDNKDENNQFEKETSIVTTTVGTIGDTVVGMTEEESETMESEEEDSNQIVQDAEVKDEEVADDLE